MSEEYYDQEIAPVLAELSTKCRKQGMSFLAIVEYDKDSRGLTQALVKDASVCMMMTTMCLWAKGNVDSFLINLIKWCREKNIDLSQSMFLRQYADNPACNCGFTNCNGSEYK